MKQKINRIIFILIAGFFTQALFAVNRHKDTLLKVIQSNTTDSCKIEAYYLLGYQHTKAEKAKAEFYFNEAEKLCLKNHSPMICEVYRHRAIYYRSHGDLAMALDQINKSIELAKAFPHYLYLSMGYAYAGMQIFSDLGMKEEAIKEIRKAIYYEHKLPPPHDIANTYYLLGWLEFNSRSYDSALVHLKKSVEYSIHSPDVSAKIEFLGWVGNAYSGVKDYKNAILYRHKAKHIADSAKIEHLRFDCDRYLGMFYFRLKNYDSTLFYLNSAADYFKKDNNMLRHAICLQFLIMNGLNNNKIAESKKFVEELMDTSKFNYYKYEDAKLIAANALGLYFKKTGDYKKALQYFSDYMSTSDSINKRNKNIEINEQNLKYNFLKEQEEIKLNQQRKDIEAIESLKKQKTFTFLSLAGVIIGIILLVFAYKTIRQKQNAYKVISTQKAEVETQKLLVEIKNKEIHDSINYAKRLQEAILPNTFEIRTSFNEFFLLYKPKDIVAGDFYFFDHLKNSHIIAAADCTGHGVPGAMVSVVCSNALTRSVKEFKIAESGKILDKTRELVLETFSKSAVDVKDGMDISLMVIEKTTENKFNVQWSGANNCLWYFNAGIFIELKADKQPIGLSDDPKPFTTHKISANSGDQFYLFTDGYADQFGGPKGKKLKYKLLEEIIKNNFQQPLTNQLNSLDSFFVDWKGNLEQLDDVCILGIKL